ncbi:LacI family DNA-binding transcriptional regulator [Vallitalea longa]|nr:LacI family DNA-binding transcriptional regulator [Vallitalea longa]
MNTIQDVAHEAGVSVATVSRVINNNDNVSTNTKNKVLKAINKLEYTPNLLGRNLRKKRTYKVLVLVPTLSNEFYSEIVRGVEDVASKDNYYVMVCSTHSNKETEKAYLNMFYNQLIDGIIFTAPEMSGEEMMDIANKYPVIQCSEYIRDSEVSWVSINNYQASYDAIKYLIDIGHKDIAIIGSENGFVSSIKRQQGYMKALQHNNIKINNDYIIQTNYEYEDGINGCIKLMNLEKPPTAIFCGSDAIAVGVIRQLTKQGIQVGEEISVIGFDDTNFAAYYNPPITTISQPRYEMGKIAMELLLRKINNIKCKNEYIILDHKLTIRESTITE